MKKSKIELTCKQCGKKYDPAEVKRTLGGESMVYQLGYCSARCYTIKVTGK